MVRVLIATVVGGVLLFGWGNVSWMVLDWHDATVRSVGDADDEDALRAAITDAGLVSGFYAWPRMPEDWNDKKAMDAYTATHASGPVGTLVVKRDAGEPMPPSLFVGGGLISLATAGVLSLLVAVAGARTFIRRWMLVILAGVAAGLSGEAMTWNWFYLPTDYASVMMADRLTGFVIAGLAIALIVRPRPAADAAA